jgi:hypothetical protein
MCTKAEKVDRKLADLAACGRGGWLHRHLSRALLYGPRDALT